MNRKVNQKGFTLIELLIVIVIIGILSGVLISVIDPIRQQNRSRNAAAKAAINKASFAINTARAGIGHLPDNSEVQDELENMTPVSAALCDPAATVLDCVFTLAGTNLPGNCGANFWSENGTNQCGFYAFGDAANPNSAQFRLISKAFLLDPGSATEPQLYYVFDSSIGFYQCDFATTSTANMEDFTYDIVTNCEPIDTQN